MAGNGLRALDWSPTSLGRVGYSPFDPQAANLMFRLVSSRYERASMIVSSNKAFSAWGEIFGDEIVAVAMIDRLIDHAEILSLKGDSYRLKDRDLGGRPPARGTPHLLPPNPKAAHRRKGEPATVVSDLDRRRVIDVLDGRSRHTVDRYLQELPEPD